MQFDLRVCECVRVRQGLVKFYAQPVTILIRYLSTVSQLFLCSSKSFLKFRLSGTRLLIKWFLIKKRVVLKVS